MKWRLPVDAEQVLRLCQALRDDERVMVRGALNGSRCFNVALDLCEVVPRDGQPPEATTIEGGYLQWTTLPGYFGVVWVTVLRRRDGVDDVVVEGAIRGMWV